MQEMADKIVGSVGILVAAISTLLTVLAPLVGLFTSALVSSGIIAADSKWAVFVAKLFPLTVHATSTKAKVKIPTGPIALLLVALAAGGTQPACSLEAARQARIQSQTSVSAPAKVRPEAECRTLDNVHVGTMYGAEFSLGVGVGAGALAAADTGQKVENIAIGAGIGAATAAAALGYWSQKSGALWTEQCSQ